MGAKSDTVQGFSTISLTSFGPANSATQSMGPAFLPAVDLRQSLDESQGLTFRQLSYFKFVYADIEPDTVDAALDHLAKTSGQLETSFNATSLSSVDDIVALLEAGAAQVFVTAQQLRSLAPVKNVDQKRTVSTVEAESADVLEKSCETVRGPIYLANVRDVAGIKSCMNRRGHDDGSVFVGLNSSTADSITAIAQMAAVPIVPARLLTSDLTPSSSQVNASQIFMAGAVSDRPDGLFTTLVADERGTALGLVYSSKESVAESLRLGRGVYQSRKRGLWYKGDISGDIQELVNVAFDCDADCLHFTVKQLGRGTSIVSILRFFFLLTQGRLLPSRSSNLLWTLSWIISTFEDFASSKRVSSPRIVYFTAV